MISITNELKLSKKIFKKRYIYSNSIKVAYSFYSLLFYFDTTERDIFKYQNKSYAFDLFITGGCNITSNSSKSQIAKKIARRIIIPRLQSTKINPKYLNYF